jgi:hypothetical protein
MKVGEDGEVRTCRTEGLFGRIFYESASIDAVFAKFSVAIAVDG